MLTDPDGGVLLADAAALTPDLTEGLISSARLLIDGKLQLAAAEARRERRALRHASTRWSPAPARSAPATRPRPGRSAPRASPATPKSAGSTSRTPASRCSACRSAYVAAAVDPRARASSAPAGVLVPGFSQSDIYGFGFKLPYYRVLGPSADATVTPFVTTSGGVLLEGEYRRRFAAGGFDLWGVVTLDFSLDGHPGRGALFAERRLPPARRLRHRLRRRSLPSDDSFLQQYDYSDADRLTSYVRVSRTRADEYVELGAVGFQSLRDDEDTATVPFAFPVLTYRRLTEAPMIGGRVGIDANVARHPARRRHQHGPRRRRHRLGPAVVAAAGRDGRDHRTGGARHLPGLERRGAAGRHLGPRHADRFGARPMAAGAQHGACRPCHRADRPGDLVRLSGRDRRAERGQPVAGVRRDQPVLAQPLPRRGPAGDRPARQPRHPLHPIRPVRLVGRRHVRPGGPRRGRSPSTRTAAASRAAGPTTSGRSTSTSAPACKPSSARPSHRSSTSAATSSRWRGTPSAPD